MDLFMDKLSQKTTAQEIIRANTAADIEELNKWKRQAFDYGECLAKMQRLVDEGLAKLARSEAVDSRLGSLAEENADAVRALRKDVESLGQCMESLGQSMEKLQEQIAETERQFSGKLESVAQTLGEQGDAADPTLPEAVIEKFDTVEENVHKECVKVYRNVQAVVQEESTKLWGELKTAVKKARGKSQLAMVFAIFAMLFSLAGVVLQILDMMHLIAF